MRVKQRGERKGWSLVYIHNSYYSLLFSRDRGVVIKRTPITLPIQLYYGARLMGPSKLSYRFIALIYRDSVICKRALVSNALRAINVRACARNAKNYSRYSRGVQGLIKLDRYAPSRSIVADEDVTENDRLVSDNMMALTCVSPLCRCRTDLGFTMSEQ